MISVEQAIEDLKNGKMLVMVDDVDRENEGDLVFARAHVSGTRGPGIGLAGPAAVRNPVPVRHHSCRDPQGHCIVAS